MVGTKLFPQWQNTLAYYDTATITAVKRFIEQPHMCVVLLLKFKFFFLFSPKMANLLSEVSKQFFVLLFLCHLRLVLYWKLY